MRTLRRLVSHFKKKRPLHDHRSEERAEMTTNHTRRYQPTFGSRIDSKGSDTLEQLNRQAKRNRTDPFDFNEYPSVGHFFWVKSKIASRFDSNEIVSPAISDLDFDFVRATRHGLVVSTRLAHWLTTSRSKNQSQ